jgi:hypothetical protein
MTIDTDPSTLRLFDNTASPDWNHHTPPTSSDANEGDEADGNEDTDEDSGASALVIDPVARGSNFHLVADRALPRGWPARARDNIAAINLSKVLEQSGRAPTAGKNRRDPRRRAHRDGRSLSGFGSLRSRAGFISELRTRPGPVAREREAGAGAARLV